jgi:hypothetical protein
MPKDLPENWVLGKQKSLNVATDLGLRNVPAGNLVIYKCPPSKNSKLLLCRWLPIEEEDTREFQGRTNGGKGKRKYLEGTTGFEDPFQAGKSAITWCVEKRKHLQALGEEKKYQSKHSLQHYWGVWWNAFQDRTDKSHRTKQDTLGKWQGKGWGIGEQKWSHKSIDEVNALDLDDYFKLLDARGSGAKQKEALKTLLNHLNKTARKDFPLLQPFIFPTISKQTNEVENFSKDEWDLICNKVIDLSGGVANKTLTLQQYEELEWSPKNKFNQRHWVDFYDCLMLMFFFYLRSEDMPRIKSEWFDDQGDSVTLYLRKMKSNRDLRITHHYYPDGYKFWKKMNKRKPKGYLGFPLYKRKAGLGEEQESNVVEMLNLMLKRVVDLCHIKKRKVVWTVIRHTAFTLTLKEMPELGVPPDIDTFGINGGTSADQLRKKYLYKIDSEGVAKKAQKKLKSHSWSMMRSVSLDD